jgi:hypothetical protein
MSLQNNFKIKDEYFTPPILVNMILPYLKTFANGKDIKILCPFDKPESEFVRILSKDYDVTYSHIDEKDFFNYTLDELRAFNIVISNPPFSRKLDIMKRLYEAEISFALIINLMCINYQEIGNFFLDKELQLLIPDKKVSFDGNTTSFNSSYFCNKFLLKQIIFEHLENNNRTKKYIGSAMYRK